MGLRKVDKKTLERPSYLKGILDEDDIKIANKLEIQGIIISNHGGDN